MRDIIKSRIKLLGEVMEYLIKKYVVVVIGSNGLIRQQSDAHFWAECESIYFDYIECYTDSFSDGISFSVFIVPLGDKRLNYPVYDENLDLYYNKDGSCFPAF